MKYLQRSFTFVGSTSDTYAHARAVCGDTGHMSTDVRGKCLRCSAKISEPRPQPRLANPLDGYTFDPVLGHWYRDFSHGREYLVGLLP